MAPPPLAALLSVKVAWDKVSVPVPASLMEAPPPAPLPRIMVTSLMLTSTALASVSMLMAGADGAGWMVAWRPLIVRLTGTTSPAVSL